MEKLKHFLKNFSKKRVPSILKLNLNNVLLIWLLGVVCGQLLMLFLMRERTITTPNGLRIGMKVQTTHQFYVNSGKKITGRITNFERTSDKGWMCVVRSMENAELFGLHWTYLKAYTETPLEKQLKSILENK